MPYISFPQHIIIFKKLSWYKLQLNLIINFIEKYREGFRLWDWTNFYVCLMGLRDNNTNNYWYWFCVCFYDALIGFWIVLLLKFIVITNLIIIGLVISHLYHKACNKGYHRYFDLHLEIDSEGWLRTKLYNKRDDFNIPIVNFPFIYSNIPAAPAYEVDISQLIRYFRACGSCRDFLDRWLLLTRKLLHQGSYWLSWSYHFESFSVTTIYDR